MQYYLLISFFSIFTVKIHIASTKKILLQKNIKNCFRDLHRSLLMGCTVPKPIWSFAQSACPGRII